MKESRKHIDEMTKSGLKFELDNLRDEYALLMVKTDSRMWFLNLFNDKIVYTTFYTDWRKTWNKKKEKRGVNTLLS